MVREHVEEYLLDECPNCGAPRKNEERECVYCGTSLVQTRVVRADVNSEHFPVVKENNKKKALDNMGREPDIKSAAPPPKNRTSSQGGWVSDYRKHLPNLLCRESDKV